MDTRHYAILLAGVVVLSTGMATAVPSASTALQQQETATVSFADQSVGDGAVTVESATLPEGGFVVIHAVEDGEPGEVVGVTEYLAAGTAADVQARLDEELDEEQDLVAMGHMDTDGDETFDVVETDGAEDGPDTTDGEAVTDTASVAPAETADEAEQPADEAEEPVDEGMEMPEADNETEEGFVVTDLDAPANATIGRTLPVTATVENGGDEEQTQRVEFRLGGALVADQSLTLGPGEEETVTFDVRTGLYNFTDGQFYHGVFTEDDGQVATINLTQSFEIADLDAPESADVGDNVTVNGTVENPNGMAGTQVVEFRFDGAVVDNATLTLEGGENETVTFAVNSSGLPNRTFVHAVFTQTDGVFADIELASTPEQPVETPEPNATETPTDTETEASADNETEVPVDNETEAPTETEIETEAPADNETEAPETETEGQVPVTEVQQTATPEPGTETPSAQGNASVSLADQAGDGRNVTVEDVSLSDGGFVAIHDQRLFEGDAVGSVVGVSAFLEPGEYENVTVTLFDVPGATYENDTLTEGRTLVAMPHRDTNWNGTCDFVATNGSADGPYLNEAGEAVVDDGRVVVEAGTPAE